MQINARIEDCVDGDGSKYQKAVGEISITEEETTENTNKLLAISIKLLLEKFLEAELKRDGGHPGSISEQVEYLQEIIGMDIDSHAYWINILKRMIEGFDIIASDPDHVDEMTLELAFSDFAKHFTGCWGAWS